MYLPEEFQLHSKAINRTIGDKLENGSSLTPQESAIVTLLAMNSDIPVNNEMIEASTEYVTQLTQQIMETPLHYSEADNPHEMENIRSNRLELMKDLSALFSTKSRLDLSAQHRQAAITSKSSLSLFMQLEGSDEALDPAKIVQNVNTGSYARSINNDAASFHVSPEVFHSINDFMGSLMKLYKSYSDKGLEESYVSDSDKNPESNSTKYKDKITVEIVNTADDLSSANFNSIIDLHRENVHGVGQYMKSHKPQPVQEKRAVMGKLREIAASGKKSIFGRRLPSISSSRDNNNNIR